MDFGKFKYDMSKQEKNQAKKEGGLKEIRLSAKIDTHDLEFKAKQVIGFIEKGYQVRVSMRLVGRENIFVDRALEVFNKFAENAGLSYENTPKKVGNRIEAMLSKVKKDAKTENPQRNS
jgi:translation initiation factor IF-3